MTIKQRQCLLTYLGYDPGPIDGLDGPKTQAALERFRTDYGVGADGLAGAVGGMVPKLKKPHAAPESGKTGTFWDDIQYFTRNEFRCPCGKCGGFPVEPEERLVRAMDDMREALGVPVIVVPPDGHSGGSGVRCQRYNDSLPGSVPNSRHVLGKAADFSAPGATAKRIELYLADIQSRGIIRYWYRIRPGAYHMDVT